MKTLFTQTTSRTSTPQPGTGRTTGKPARQQRLMLSVNSFGLLKLYI